MASSTDTEATAVSNRTVEGQLNGVGATNVTADYDLLYRQEENLRRRRAVKRSLYNHVSFHVAHYADRVTAVLIDHDGYELLEDLRELSLIHI